MSSTRHTHDCSRLSPFDFERLCYWLVRAEGYERLEYLGESGSEQGRDVQAVRDGRRVVFQCKRVKAFGLAGAKAEIAKLRLLPPGEQPHELIFVVATAVSADLRKKIRAAWGDPETCDFWAGAELDAKVKLYTAVEREFFGEPRAFVHNLPLDSLGDLFKGRERELAELERALATDTPAAQVQAPTLQGLGGVGKTRLAVECAETVLARTWRPW